MDRMVRAVRQDDWPSCIEDHANDLGASVDMVYIMPPDFHDGEQGKAYYYHFFRDGGCLCNVVRVLDNEITCQYPRGIAKDFLLSACSAAAHDHMTEFDLGLMGFAAIMSDVLDDRETDGK